MKNFLLSKCLLLFFFYVIVFVLENYFFPKTGSMQEWCHEGNSFIEKSSDIIVHNYSQEISIYANLIKSKDRFQHQWLKRDEMEIHPSHKRVSKIVFIITLHSNTIQPFKGHSVNRYPILFHYHFLIRRSLYKEAKYKKGHKFNIWQHWQILLFNFHLNFH